MSPTLKDIKQKFYDAACEATDGRLDNAMEYEEVQAEYDARISAAVDLVCTLVQNAYREGHAYASDPAKQFKNSTTGWFDSEVKRDMERES